MSDGQGPADADHEGGDPLVSDPSATDPAAPVGTPPDGRGSVRRRSSRSLGVLGIALVAAAALLWAGSATVWFTVRPPGRAVVELTGAEISGVPGAVALLALAAVAAIVATRGALRRVVGALLAMAGGAAAVVAARGRFVDPFTQGIPASARPVLPPGASAEALREQQITATAAPLLALAGAAVVIGVGLFALLSESRLAHPGARVGARRESPADLDPDRSAWQELDAGRDPTVGPAAGRRDDPGDSGRIGAV